MPAGDAANRYSTCGVNKLIREPFAWILHDQLSLASYALKLSFKGSDVWESFLTTLPVGETGQD